MSAIAGICYWDGRDVAREELLAMAKALAHRGPDGKNIWHKGPIGLVHLMLHTTPESLNERLPLEDKATGLVITSDARIDNREELLESLGVKGREASQMPDSELILKAYKKWGRKCPERLLGDFAFAIWDSRERTLFCARDHMGVKPFYYYASRDFFAFSTEIKGLLALNNVSRRINEVRIADFLAAIVLDNESTFWRSILRLPPAHFCVIRNGIFEKGAYWQLPSEPKKHIKRDSEYAEEFRHIFTEAVRCRLRSAFPLGSYLSGGLDSSSIVCVAAELYEKKGIDGPHVFSGIFDEIAQCDERKYFMPVVERYNLPTTFVYADRLEPLAELEKMLNEQDEPFFAPHIFMSRALLGLARENGFRIMLDGHDGDNTVSYGTGLLLELAGDFKWLKLAKECYCLTDGSLHEALEIAYVAIRRRCVPLSIKCMAKVVRQILHIFKAERQKESQELIKPPWHNILNDEFIKKTGLIERWRDFKKNDPYRGDREFERHRRALYQPFMPYGLEVLDRCVSNFGIEARYPYFDKRLIEFCLDLPARLKLHRGLNRYIVRFALKDILPESIRKRKNKSDFTANLIHGLRVRDRDRLQQFLQKISHEHKEFYQVQEIERIREGFLNMDQNPTASDAFTLLKILVLTLWISSAKNIFH
ncbi:Asparagine synthetase (glutamine-hydrolyzing) [Dissulfuribacter thermophilus]|uniref:asparagine synthase (glutamine-hydrolyzing) n=1 Tax=Dissulfuribacter thermophilus TaxID=1156395 RepID=A0A1B9F6V6_9BACT|nr:lasso peptide isopeptide bond-forming cyclase [Dissulfuribacter thermophilus]OCC15630.1 Asparagine synthetase (glutamine-hydrolyzing) [Dissulfuribacter thermophilus]